MSFANTSGMAPRAPKAFSDKQDFMSTLKLPDPTVAQAFVYFSEELWPQISKLIHDRLQTMGTFCSVAPMVQDDKKGFYNPWIVVRAIPSAKETSTEDLKKAVQDLMLENGLRNPMYNIHIEPSKRGTKPPPIETEFNINNFRSQPADLIYLEPKPDAMRTPRKLSVSETLPNLLDEAFDAAARDNMEGRDTTRSVKHLTCWYWMNHEHGCIKTDDECSYAHFETGRYAERPRSIYPGGPRLAGRNASRIEANLRKDLAMHIEMEASKSAAAGAGSTTPTDNPRPRSAHMFNIGARATTPANAHASSVPAGSFEFGPHVVTPNIDGTASHSAGKVPAGGKADTPTGADNGSRFANPAVPGVTRPASSDVNRISGSTNPFKGVVHLGNGMQGTVFFEPIQYQAHVDFNAISNTTPNSNPTFEKAKQSSNGGRSKRFRQHVKEFKVKQENILVANTMAARELCIGLDHGIKNLTDVIHNTTDLHNALISINSTLDTGRDISIARTVKAKLDALTSDSKNAIRLLSAHRARAENILKNEDNAKDVFGWWDPAPHASDAQGSFAPGFAYAGRPDEVGTAATESAVTDEAETEGGVGLDAAAEFGNGSCAIIDDSFADDESGANAME